MKYLFIIFISLFILIIPQNNNSDLKKLQKSTDEFTDITTYSPYLTNPKFSSIYFYMTGNKNEIFDGRIVIQYYEKDWIFFNEMIVICDGEKYSYTMGTIFNTRDVVTNGYVLEKYDYNVETYPFWRELISIISKSKIVKIRFQGKKYDILGENPTDTKYDFQLSNNQISNIKQYYSVYNKYFPIDTMAFNADIGFKQFQWGDHISIIKSKEKLKYLDMSWSSVFNGKIAYDFNILGYNATLWYEFDTDSNLIETTYIFSIEENYDKIYMDIYKRMELNAFSQNKSHELIKSDKKFIGNNYYITSTWKFGASVVDIMVVVKYDDKETLCSISFKPIQNKNSKKS